MLGRIPQNRLYPLGLNILKMWPMPTSSSVPGQELWSSSGLPRDTLQYQPAFRFDYQVACRALRVSYKYQGQIDRKQVTQGTIPGFNDVDDALHRDRGTDAVTANYNLSSTMFLEGTFGRAWNQLAGCGWTAGQFGLGRADRRPGGFPASSFRSANVINPDYYAYGTLNFQGPAYWDGSRIWKVPSFHLGQSDRWKQRRGRAAQCRLPRLPQRQQDARISSISLTKVAGRHNFKTGFYQTHSLKRENGGAATVAGNNFGDVSFANDTANAFDTSFGFANAAIGSFTSFTPGVGVRRRHLHVQPIRRSTCRTTGR